MSRKLHRDVNILALVIVLATAIASAITIHPSLAQGEAVVKVYPQLIELGPENATGTEFGVAVAVENITGLYGFDIKFRYNTTYLQYINHTKTIPVETYDTPQAPSPYAGILHGVDNAPLKVKDVVNTTTGIYQIAYATFAPELAFDGNGTVFTMFFRLIYHQQLEDVTLLFDFVDTKLSDQSAIAIPHTEEPGTLELAGIQPEPHPVPTLEMESAEYYGDVPAALDLDLSILDLESYWDLVGFDIRVTFDPNFVQVADVTAGPFLEQFNMTFEIRNQINNTAGYVRLAFFQVVPPDERLIPSGTGVLFTLQVDAQPTSRTELTIAQSDLASFPHPERPEQPWGGDPWSVPINHNVTDGTLKVIHRKTHTITIGADEFEVITESNSTVSDIDASRLVVNGMIRFIATGVTGYTGYCNVTLPRDFLYAAPDNWTIWVAGYNVSYSATEDNANAYVYFTYDFASTQPIAVFGTEWVPEFSTTAMVALFMALTLAAAVLARKIVRKGKVAATGKNLI
jgi:hypothetical protein